MSNVLILLPTRTDQTSRLTGPSNPADKAGKEETEAKGDHWVGPEHLAVHKPGQNFGDFLNSASETLMIDQPCDGDGGCEDPGHVADDYAAKQLGKGRWREFEGFVFV